MVQGLPVARPGGARRLISRGPPPRAVRILLAACAALALAAAPGAHAEIPDWVREVAALWGQGAISDAEFAGAIRYLAWAGVVELPDPAPGQIAAGLPFSIGHEHTVPEPAPCEIVIHGVSGGYIDARAEPPGPCDIRTYEEAEGLMVGGIGAVYANGSRHVAYTPWEPFDGDVSSWAVGPGEVEYVEIVFHVVSGAEQDAYGTIFFDRGAASSVRLYP